MLKKGIDILDTDVDVNVGSNKKKSKPWYNSVEEFFQKFFEFLTPLSSKMETITIQEDKSVVSFFEIYRFLIGQSIFMFLIFLPLFIFQISQSTQEITKLDMCGVLPCIMTYSGFGTNTSIYFPITFCVFIFAGMIGCFYKWIIFDRQVKRIKTFNDQEYSVAGRLFNAWDWDNKNKSLLVDYP